MGYASESKLSLNIDKVCALEWKPKFNLVEMYQRLIADLKVE